MATSVTVETKRSSYVDEVTLESGLEDALVLFVSSKFNAEGPKRVAAYVGKDQALKLATGLIKFARKLED